MTFRWRVKAIVLLVIGLAAGAKAAYTGWKQPSMYYPPLLGTTTPATSIATMLNVSGSFNLDGFQGQNIGSFVVPNTVATLLFGPGSYTFTGPITNNVQRNMTVECSNRGTQLNVTAGNWLAWTGAQTPGISGQRLTKFAGCSLLGGNTAANGLIMPDNSGGVSLFDGHTIIRDWFAQQFINDCVYVGTSNYVTVLEDTEVKDCGIDVDIAHDADTFIYSGVFSYPSDIAMIRLGANQSHIIGSVMDRGAAHTGTSGSGPDILMTTGGNGAIMASAEYIVGNKHGTEGEISNRTKIKIYDASNLSAFSASDVFANNWYYAYDGTNIAFDFENPISSVLLSGNYFSDIGTIIKDNFASTGDINGGSVFDQNNRIENTGTVYSQLCANGCRGFWLIKPPQNVAHITLPEPLLGPAQQRLPHPQDFSTWSISAGITVTCGQTDPWGGTDGCKLNKTSTSSSLSVSSGYNATNILDDLGNVAASNSITRSGRAWFSIWLKAGTCKVASVLAYDNTYGNYFNKLFSLPSGNYQHIAFELTGIDPTLSPGIYIYPCGISSGGTGYIYVAHASISDFGSPWLPNQTLSQSMSQNGMLLFSPALTPAAVNGATVSVQRFAVTGLRIGDVVTINSPSGGQTANIALGQALVAANDNVDVSFINPTAGILTPASGTYLISVTRTQQ